MHIKKSGLLRSKFVIQQKNNDESRATQVDSTTSHRKTDTLAGPCKCECAGNATTCTTQQKEILVVMDHCTWFLVGKVRVVGSFPHA